MKIVNVLLSVILVVLIYIACRNPETVVIPPPQTPQITVPAPVVAVQNSLPPYTIDDIHWAQKGEYGTVGGDLDLAYSFTVHNNTTNQLSIFLKVEFPDVAHPTVFYGSYEDVKLNGYGAENFTGKSVASSLSIISSIRIQEDKK